jgi:hypothetical protein
MSTHKVERFPNPMPSQTLQDWRDQKGPYLRNFWIPFEPFFLSKGYILWGPQSTWFLVPPNDKPRVPDGFAYSTIYHEIPPDRYSFTMTVSPTTLFFQNLTAR